MSGEEASHCEQTPTEGDSSPDPGHNPDQKDFGACGSSEMLQNTESTGPTEEDISTDMGDMQYPQNITDEKNSFAGTDNGPSEDLSTDMGDMQYPQNITDEKNSFAGTDNGPSEDLSTDMGDMQYPQNITDEKNSFAGTDNGPSEECLGASTEIPQATYTDEGPAEVPEFTKHTLTDLQDERTNEETSSCNTFETAKSITEENETVSLGLARHTQELELSSDFPQAKNSEPSSPASTHPEPPLKGKQRKTTFTLIDPLRLRRPGDPDDFNIRFMDDDDGPADEQTLPENQPHPEAWEGGARPVTQAGLEMAVKDPGGVAVTQADLEAPVTGHLPENQPHPEAWEGGARPVTQADLEMAVEDPGGVAMTQADLEAPVTGHLPRSRPRAGFPASLAATAVPYGTDFIDSQAVWPRYRAAAKRKTRSIRHTKIWQALKGWESLAATAESSDLDRYYNDDLDLIYSIVEFLGNLALAAADFVWGKSLVDWTESLVAKVITGIQYFQEAIICCKPYEWLMQMGRAFLRVTFPGRCLVTVTSWGAKAAGMVLGVVNWTYAILGLSAGPDGQRESFWRQGLVKLVIRLWAFPVWASVYLVNTAAQGVHSAVLYVRDEALGNIKRTRAKRAGTRHTRWDRERARLWRGAIRLRKHRPEETLHGWDGDKDLADSKRGGGGGGGGNGCGGGKSEGYDGGGDFDGGGYGGVGRDFGYKAREMGREEEREQDKTSTDSHNRSNEPDEGQTQNGPQSPQSEHQHKPTKENPQQRNHQDPNDPSEENQTYLIKGTHVGESSSSSPKDSKTSSEGSSSDSPDCSYVLGGYQIPTLGRSPLGERVIHVLNTRQLRNVPSAFCTASETTGTSRNTEAQSFQTLPQPEEYLQKLSEGTCVDAGFSSSSCKILNPALRLSAWGHVASTPEGKEGGQGASPSGSILPYPSRFAVQVRAGVREVKVKEVGGQAVWGHGSSREEVSGLGQNSGVFEGKQSARGQAAVTRKITPVKRRLGRWLNGTSPTPFRFALPPTPPYTVGFAHLTVGQQFLCLLRKLPFLSDVIRDPRDPPPVTLLLDRPILITDDKTRRLLDLSLASQSTSGYVKRKLCDLYSEDSYDSEQDPDYQPPESLDTTDPLEYSEQDAVPETGELNDDDNDEVFHHRDPRREVEAEIHRDDEHSILLSPDRYDQTPNTREPGPNRPGLKLGRLVLAPKRPDLMPNSHDLIPNSHDLIPNSRDLQPNGDDSAPNAHNSVFSGLAGATSRDQPDFGLNRHGFTLREQEGAESEVSRRDDRGQEKDERDESTYSSKAVGTGSSVDYVLGDSDSDKENKRSRLLATDLREEAMERVD